MRTKSAMKRLVSDILSKSAKDEGYERDVSQDFVNKIIYDTLRSPKMPLPQNVDEVMHMMQQYQTQMSCL